MKRCISRQQFSANSLNQLKNNITKQQPKQKPVDLFQKTWLTSSRQMSSSSRSWLLITSRQGEAATPTDPQRQGSRKGSFIHFGRNSPWHPAAEVMASVSSAVLAVLRAGSTTTQQLLRWEGSFSALIGDRAEKTNGWRVQYLKFSQIFTKSNAYPHPETLSKARKP